MGKRTPFTGKIKKALKRFLSRIFSLKFLLPVAFVVLGIFSFKYLKESKPVSQSKPAVEKVWSVHVKTLQAETLTPEILIQGIVEAPNIFNGAAPGAAWVEKVNVREGDTVSAGDVLAALDPQDFIAGLTQAKAELADIQAQMIESEIRNQQDKVALVDEREILKLIRKSVERNAALNDRALGATSTLENAQKELVRQQLAINQRVLAVKTYESRTHQLEARKQRIIAQIEESNRALARSQVIAPYDGVVSKVHVAIGSRVNAGFELVSMYALDELEVRGLIPTRYRAEIAEALNNGKELTAKSLSSNEEYNLIRLAGVSLPGGVDGFFKLKSKTAFSANLGGLLTLVLKRPARDGLYQIPPAAIYDNTRIYVLREGRLAAVNIEIIGQMEQSGQTVRIARIEGLTDNEQLVVTRLPNAITGLKVQAIEKSG